MKEIIEALIKFRNDRDWQRFHTPENLAKSITIEAAELLENFQWGSEFANLDNVKEELADVMIYALLLCESYQFDVESIIKEKIEKNRKKYPTE